MGIREEDVSNCGKRKKGRMEENNRWKKGYDRKGRIYRREMKERDGLKDGWERMVKFIEESGEV